MWVVVHISRYFWFPVHCVTREMLLRIMIFREREQRAYNLIISLKEESSTAPKASSSHTAILRKDSFLIPESRPRDLPYCFPTWRWPVLLTTDLALVWFSNIFFWVMNTSLILPCIKQVAWIRNQPSSQANRQYVSLKIVKSIVNFSVSHRTSNENVDLLEENRVCHRSQGAAQGMLPEN